MKTVTLNIDDNLFLFYKEISIVLNKSVEEILEDTLIKTADMISNKTLLKGE